MSDLRKHLIGTIIMDAGAMALAVNAMIFHGWLDVVALGLFMIGFATIRQAEESINISYGKAQGRYEMLKEIQQEDAARELQDAIYGRVPQ